jgi:2-polyprenyl-6-methoxyphenol hydroxylase-like FAD-dependent oxidoreductase
MTKNVAIFGAGIASLSAAHEFSQRGTQPGRRCSDHGSVLIGRMRPCIMWVCFLAEISALGHRTSTKLTRMGLRGNTSRCVAGR